MNSEIKPVLSELVGKTIAHIVVKEGESPRAHLFLVFTDGTSYEFYSGSSIDGSARLDYGGLAHALRYLTPPQEVVFQC